MMPSPLSVHNEENKQINHTRVRFSDGGKPKKMKKKESFTSLSKMERKRAVGRGDSASLMVMKSKRGNNACLVVAF